jgi:2,3-bisphosphoglycerate-dependent phosphoglycerate mutase
MPRTLVLCRHGQSEWNKLDLFTGWKDPGLTELGVAEAKAGGKRLAALGLTFDVAFTSALSRAQVTCGLILEEMGLVGLPTIRDWRLNERDYGDLSGLNKTETAAKFGPEQVLIWRRSFDVPPPGGESLKMTAERVLPYYRQHIEPRAKRGDDVLVAAHGNSLRALVMALEGLSGEQIVKRELATGVPLVYRLDGQGRVVDYRELTGQ